MPHHARDSRSYPAAGRGSMSEDHELWRTDLFPSDQPAPRADQRRQLAVAACLAMYWQLGLASRGSDLHVSVLGGGRLTWADDVRGSQAWSHGPEGGCRCRADLRHSHDEAAAGARMGHGRCQPLAFPDVRRLRRNRPLGLVLAAREDCCRRSEGGAPDRIRTCAHGSGGHIHVPC